MRPINWAAIHNRLNQARVLSERNVTPSPEEKRLRLKNRAKSLAQVFEAAPETGAYLDVTTFLLSGVTYAIELTHIRDVYSLKELTPIPCTPPFVAGIVNVRGQILPVIDLKAIFDLPPDHHTEFKKIIILHSDQTELAILADAVEGIRAIPVAGIQAPLTAATDSRGGYIKGITNDPLIIIDPVKILADLQLVVNEEVEF